MQYNFERLEVYQLAEELITSVYAIVRQFPREELYALADQIKRAVISIALNIAEGATGKTKKEFIRYLAIAIGSLAETKAVLMIAVKLNFIPVTELEKLNPKLDTLFFKLTALKKSLNAK